MKRVADVPRDARSIGYDSKISKADLLEVAWDLACLQNPTSCDDENETLDSLLDAINVRREIRGERRLKPGDFK